MCIIVVCVFEYGSRVDLTEAPGTRAIPGGKGWAAALSSDIGPISRGSTEQLLVRLPRTHRKHARRERLLLACTPRPE